MSMAICPRCDALVDTDDDPEFYRDDGEACEACRDRADAQAMADHAYLRGLPRHAVFNDAQAQEERDQELRDAGRGHLVKS